MVDQKSNVAAPNNHWSFENDNGILWLHFHKADASTNTLSCEALEALDAILNEVEACVPRALIILSDKASGFIAGADVAEFKPVRTEEQALDIIHRGQRIFNRIEGFSFPTVAMIHGFCLGGGMELALACVYRVADDESSRLGLPEVLLGIHPGFGGTVRAPKLVGIFQAMNMMLTGRALNARAAKKIGLIDAAVPMRHLRAAALDFATRNPGRPELAWWLRMANTAPFRNLIAKLLRKQVRARANPEHYPAPYAIINLWEEYAERPHQMMREEALSLARVITGKAAQNLVRVFFLQENLKRQGNAKQVTAKHVHVIGAGVMGGDIAAWCAFKGFRVTLQDREPKFIAPAIKRAFDLYKKKLKLPRLVQAKADQLIPDHRGYGIENADIIIEAIYENLEAKQQLFQDLERRAKPDAILASNTSSIPLTEIASAMQKPERLVGIHFFNPVAMMQLVEIVASEQTSPAIAQQAADFTRAIDRLPVPVKSSPGFLVNRILMPYLIEAVCMEAEGIPAQGIDKAATDFGMPMGPILLGDTVGLDICLHVADNLSKTMKLEVPPRLREMVAAGRLGKKSGEGFYFYQKGKPKYTKSGNGYQPSADVRDRLLFSMLNESVACLREGIVADAELLDAGIIFGTGFAPFRGGPLQYIQSENATKLHERLTQLAQRYGERFTPDPHWSVLMQ